MQSIKGYFDLIPPLILSTIAPIFFSEQINSVPEVFP
jgi:hypothetical protein